MNERNHIVLHKIIFFLTFVCLCFIIGEIHYDSVSFTRAIIAVLSASLREFGGNIAFFHISTIIEVFTVMQLVEKQLTFLCLSVLRDNNSINQCLFSHCKVCATELAWQDMYCRIHSEDSL